MVLDILVIPTYNTLTLGVADASTYNTNPPVVTAPTIEIEPSLDGEPRHFTLPALS